MLRTIVLFLILFICLYMASADDGIPDNCEYVPEVAHQFIRYEPQNRHLVLVDWRTGEDIRVVVGNLDQTMILGWSGDCQYLVGAVGNGSTTNTLVWNVNSGEQMGMVENAQYQPHHITWGPDNYIVVETRNGAILWHVPTYQQMTLTDHFDPVNVRNFSRLRWDASNMQLIANLSGGGRVIYDLLTGQEVPQVAQRTDTIPGDSTSKMIIGGAPYDCGLQTNPRYGRFSLQLNTDLTVQYNRNTKQIYIELVNEPLVILEQDVNISWFQSRGWSPDCQYVIGSLGVIGQDASDTYVWNVTTGERVGIIEDARHILHQITWHPFLPILLVETRNGAILWNLRSAQQFPLPTGAENPITGRSDIVNFSDHEWAGNFLFLAPVDAPNTVQVYDVASGILVSEIGLDQSVSFIASPNGVYGLICCSANETYMLWYRTANRLVPLTLSPHYYSPVFSPNDDYLVGNVDDGLGIWHLGSLHADGTPSIYLSDQYVDYVREFTDTTHFMTTQSIIDVTSGSVTARNGRLPVPAHHNDVSGVSGYDVRYYYSKCPLKIVDKGKIDNDNWRFHKYAIYDGSTLLYELESKGLRWSPDCKWFYGEVPYQLADAPYDNAIVDDTYRELYSDYVVFWDAQTGVPVRSFYHPYRAQTYYYVSWSPDSQYAIVRTTEGAYLYHLPTNTINLLVFPQPNDALKTSFSTYWDFERGQVLLEGWDAIYAVDLQSGAWRYTFTPRADGRGCDFWGCDIQMIDARYMMIDYAIWDLDTYASYFVTPGTIKMRTSRIKISPSGRFLVKKLHRALFVWDLHNLSENQRENTPYIVSLQNQGTGYRGFTFVTDEIVEIEVEGGENYTLSLLQQ